MVGNYANNKTCAINFELKRKLICVKKIEVSILLLTFILD